MNALVFAPVRARKDPPPGVTLAHASEYIRVPLRLAPGRAGQAIESQTMVAWIDTPPGRRQSALRAARITLAGLGVAVIGVLAWGPLVWIGGIVAIVGAARVVWAHVRATRSERVRMPSSKNCERQDHEGCRPTHAGGKPCGCSCHFSQSFYVRRLDGAPLGDRETVQGAIQAACPGVRTYRGDVLSRHGATYVQVEAPAGGAERFPDQPIRLDVEGQGHWLRFDLGYETFPVIDHVDVEARGRDFLPLLDQLARQTGWVIVDALGTPVAGRR